MPYHFRHTSNTPDLQHDALKKAGCKKFYTDSASGVKADRPALNEVLEYIRKGDCFLDRLGRSLNHLIEVVEDLENRKVGFISLQEGISTTTAGGRLVFHLFGALSEFERNLIREGTCAGPCVGLAAARARGRMGGRKHKLTPAQVKTLLSMYDSQKHTIREICKVMGISKPTLYAYLKRQNKSMRIWWMTRADRDDKRWNE